MNNFKLKFKTTSNEAEITRAYYLYRVSVKRQKTCDLIKVRIVQTHAKITSQSWNLTVEKRSV
jgi:hypothetical protein